MAHLSKGRFESLKKRFLEIQVIRTFRTYWSLYGGWKSLIYSPYIYLAIIFTGFSYPFWHCERTGERPWVQTSLDIIPSMLGFSMGGMAIVLAFSGTDVFKYVTQKGREDSYFMKIVATFFHYILVQTIAIMLALLNRSYSNDYIAALGYFSMSYAILVALATAGMLLNASRVFNYGSFQPDDNSEDQSEI